MSRLSDKRRSAGEQCLARANGHRRETPATKVCDACGVECCDACVEFDRVLCWDVCRRCREIIDAVEARRALMVSPREQGGSDGN